MYLGPVELIHGIMNAQKRGSGGIDKCINQALLLDKICLYYGS